MGRRHESVASETRSGENCADGQHQAAGRSNGAGGALTTRCRARTIGVRRGSCRGPVRELSQPADPDDRALPRRRAERHRGAPDRPDHEPRLGTAGGDRKPARRQHHHRRAGSGEGAARRLHAVHGDRFDAGHEPVRAQEPALRPVRRLRADHADRQDHIGAGGFYREQTQERQGADGTREGAAGLDIVYVPFKCTPETGNGLLTGSVELIYAANQIVAPLITSGQVRALAKLDRDAPPSMADIPTLAEAAGLPDLEDISVWLGLVAPKGTPKPIIEKIHAEVAKVLTDPAIKEKSERTGNYPVTSTPDEFSAFIRKEARRWEKVIKETGIKFD